ncbi:oxygen-insensitive NADPH nitroreductase [Paenibacillus chitinolyticus]|uniref:Oxygen-insensitive NADPH nitroreductase n=1 Tax=Paenibacillus chitinolyticus TaxID=79263 RepID=A0A410X327_9BACL|nr:oxygen-insensitive NADPH nitroreductase [Paenibacillus chitinolyticus]MCY9588917.1 oxygen-insensitive NADPH nitroreductase [Paenibacillus chitinolyticus]MCY9597770.1 oxygen-insensitive NADPH nitroreductase [Paenibacillus chitinolyticus]QAV21020.1 oxygen-insensitive NADPH nitroreductase [Paenibacillus chitinolyticus]
MNSVIDLLTRHRSIRKFKPDPIPGDQLQAIIASAQMASTSSSVQAYTIIAATDPALKKELARLAGNQAYVEQCGLFLVFCADLNRLRKATEQSGEVFHQNTESFLVASMDAALAAQNAAIAAESLGLGICYIGGIRNNPDGVAEALKLPELVYPVFGMCVGVPDQEPSLRPRLPQTAVLHENGYQSDRSDEGVRRYDETTRKYYEERTGGKQSITWSRSMADKYRQPVRAHLKPFLEKQGFRLE